MNYRVVPDGWKRVSIDELTRIIRAFLAGRPGKARMYTNE
jgi:hypothetical protein